ncbi:uncharacterized protein LOC134445517 [Engraulis encrasicolus]|uniref:uncharacterized protein LOC134445517 n=1 Tax=Engraulis encrasicolus TaxID=184585 RepID=UPI002FD48C9D
MEHDRTPTSPAPDPVPGVALGPALQVPVEPEDRLPGAGCVSQGTLGLENPLPGHGPVPQEVTEPEDVPCRRMHPGTLPSHPAHEVEHIQTACPILDSDNGQIHRPADDDNMSHAESRQMAQNMNVSDCQQTTSGMDNSDQLPSTAHGVADAENQQQASHHNMNDTASIHTAHSILDSESQRLAHGMMDTDSLQTAHAMTDLDSLRHMARPFDTDSTLTNQMAYDSASNRTINPSTSDTDSNYTIHPPYPLHAHHPLIGVDGGVGGSEGGAVPTTSHATDSAHGSEDPPPYSPPDPKMAYLIYPPGMPPHYSGQPVIACQPSPNSPGFYQPQFMPSPNYNPYAIYMNGSSIGEEPLPQTLPKDYLVESLLVTIFCCIMSGLIAVMYSYETRAALARGDIRGGERASQKARFLVMFSLMFGVFVCVGWIIYAVIALCV